MSSHAQLAFHARDRFVPRTPHASSNGPREAVTRPADRLVGLLNVSCSTIPLPTGRLARGMIPARHGRAVRPDANPTSFVVNSDAGEERLLLTVVFTDIVGSTELLERVGDKAWCALLAQHRALVRGLVASHRGREVDAVGDGFLLAFQSPSRAVRFAVAVIPVLQAIGIEIRIGIHTGECEVVDGRIEGVAVHTAARVASAAGAGDILVSSTVRDVVAGSAYQFAIRERRVLKGLSDARELFALQRR